MQAKALLALRVGILIVLFGSATSPVAAVACPGATVDACVQGEAVLTRPAHVSGSGFIPLEWGASWTFPADSDALEWTGIPILDLVYTVRTVTPTAHGLLSPAEEQKRFEAAAATFELRPGGNQFVATPEGSSVEWSIPIDGELSTASSAQPLFHYGVFEGAGRHEAGSPGLLVKFRGKVPPLEMQQPLSAIVFGYDVLVRGEGGQRSYTTGRWTDSSTAGVPIEREGVLALTSNGGSLRVPAPSEFELRTPQLIVTGRVDFEPASGTLRGSHAPEDLAGRRVVLDGVYAYAVDESHAGAPGHHPLEFAGVGPASAGGRLERPAAWASPATTVAIAGGSLLLILLLIKAAVPLYTRLTRARLFHDPERARLHAALQAAPGATLAQLAATGGITESTTRYHLGVLIRHGMARAVLVQGRLRYAPVPVHLPSIERRVLLETDSKVRAVVEHLLARPRSLLEVTETFRPQWGISKVAIWKVVQRAVDAGLLVKERRGRLSLLQATAAAVTSFPVATSPPHAETSVAVAA